MRTASDIGKMTHLSDDLSKMTDDSLKRIPPKITTETVKKQLQTDGKSFGKAFLQQIALCKIHTHILLKYLVGSLAYFVYKYIKEAYKNMKD